MTCNDGLRDHACRIGDVNTTFDRELYDHDRPAERYGLFVLSAVTCIARHDPARRRGLWFRADDTASGVVVSLFGGNVKRRSTPVPHTGRPVCPAPSPTTRT